MLARSLFCWQGNTIVDPEHRGRRLGTILKIENHRPPRYTPIQRGSNDTIDAGGGHDWVDGGVGTTNLCANTETAHDCWRHVAGEPG